ncbi:sulfotransferase family protein [Actinomadura kijaniata]|uniref:sulfotransferase family protein n=1 Tax=Actinomadura kijaniata TaxID=46161 RepID=UPI00082E3F2C|nr:sulfotransferase family protein [Actinomadura kijaniata]
MKVISVGFLRTGTTSTKLALEQLGFGPAYHLRTVEGEPWRAEQWVAAAEAVKSGEPVDWEEIFAGFQSTSGDPAAPFWRQIVDAFPSAKVVLTVRDPEEWYQSVSRTIMPALKPPPLPIRLLTWRPKGRYADHLDQVHRMTWDGELEGRFADREYAIGMFEQRVADVRAHVPADRLLVYEVRSGWGPLCEFLGVPEPEGPLPHENDRDTFNRRQRQALVQQLVPRMLAGTTVVAAGLGLVALMARRRR